MRYRSNSFGNVERIAAETAAAAATSAAAVTTAAVPSASTVAPAAAVAAATATTEAATTATFTRLRFYATACFFERQLTLTAVMHSLPYSHCFLERRCSVF